MNLSSLYRTFLMFLIIGMVYAESYIIPDPPKMNAKVSYGVMDFHTKKMLVSHKINQKRQPASLTKIMTSYVVFKRLNDGLGSLSDIVIISAKAHKAIGSRSFLEQGAQVSVKDLLKALIIQSGNDASIALAEYIAGDEQPFVALMNHYAQALGMTNSNFTNASGLPDKNQYTTVYDIALLTAAMIEEFPDFYAWYAEKEFTYNNIKQRNRNNMLWLDKSVDGVKTGHTKDAGYCLVTSSVRDDMRIISAVLGATSEEERLQMTQKLLNYTFRFYESYPLAQVDDVLAQAKVYKSEKDNINVGVDKVPYLSLARGQSKNIKQLIKLPKHLIAPVERGQTLGELVVMIDDQELGSFPIVALEPAPLAGYFDRMIDSIKLMF